MLRQLEPELMDDLHLPEAPHRDALRALGRLNWWGRSAQILWRAIRPLASQRAPLRILDVATGGGDIPIALWRLARRDGVLLNLDGCDRSPVAIEHARTHARAAGAPVGWFVRDALANPLPADYDVITCSLFLHHLNDLEAIELMKRMRAAARRLVVIHDLTRSDFGVAMTWLASRLLSRSPIVRHDAPQSVRAAFTLDEIAMCARLADLPGYRLSRRWPSRFLLSWTPPA